MFVRGLRAPLLGLSLAMWITGAHAAQATVAVAANFAEPMRAVAEVLRKTTGHTLEISVGSTGRLYAQVRSGAPFDAMLAADQRVPEQLEADGLAVPGSRFTYATGKLVLWSADAAQVDARGDVLRSGAWRKLAIANPKTAPYGAAAIEAIDKLGLATGITPRLVQGESIGQAHNFVFTGNAEIGFVAMSQVLQGGRLKGGSMWVVPQALYTPIRQDAVLLKRGEHNEAARALMQLLRSESVKALIRSYGYDL
ncbi:molybdate ABC transporter substrate-binding protein [Hydrogenophaga intermedia]|uniref:molybdate ABC transporter substrate-binding protein n=1 Tax=Hydrogenophaga intermedia TaxID=65786 RepID=UPI0020436BF8|nr:molybdate ABC transporter substrate-binding protein [Hydrogenophaga intermedia]MCM3565656.1 molybdate ABC transporter substrate-binding protein [Hydrogenophaga intermedia]